MKKLILLLLVILAAYAGYRYWQNGASWNGILPDLAGLPTRDAQGRELVPCRRCLASGTIKCTAPRCENGQVPCPGPCLKLSDRGWRHMDGQDPKKLFMVYQVNEGVQGVSTAHVGEVFEVRLGKFYSLGVCKVCNGKTTIDCKVCSATGRVECPVCKGERVVLRTAENAAPAQAGGS